MGGNLARNFARHGHAVAIHNRTTAKTRSIYERFGHEGTFVPSDSTEAFVASLERPRRIIIMVKAGLARTPSSTSWSRSWRTATSSSMPATRTSSTPSVGSRRCGERGLHFVGTGVSGGEEGAPLGRASCRAAPGVVRGTGPLLEDISAKVDGTPCCVYVGRGGAGHFVKMVHNGIEYADMQLIAEAYDLLRSGVDMPVADIAAVFKEWNSGDLESFLIETTATVLSHVDAETGQPYVDVVRDEAEQKGTGRWTVQVALDLGVPVTGIAEAVLRPLALRVGGQRQAARGLPGGLAGSAAPMPTASPTTCARALRVEGRGVRPRVRPDQRGQPRLRLGHRPRRDGDDLARWLHHPGTFSSGSSRPTTTSRAAVAAAGPVLPGRRGTSAGFLATCRIHLRHAGDTCPGFATALSYYDGLRRERLPAALIQGLRDFFGAHTYRRIDRDGTWHTQWSSDLTEVSGDAFPPPQNPTPLRLSRCVRQKRCLVREDGADGDVHLLSGRAQQHLPHVPWHRLE